MPSISLGLALVMQAELGLYLTLMSSGVNSSAPLERRG